VVTPLIPVPLNPTLLIPNFTGMPASGPAPLTVQFDDTSTGPHDQWVWEFGDGNTSAEHNPLYTYNKPGSFNVTLNISQAGGEPATITHLDFITVSAVPLAPPVADFSGKPSSGIAPLTVTFSDLSSNTPTSWNWSFGDDSPENATEQNPVHAYTSIGNFTVSLNATNADGSDTKILNDYITVSAVPLAPPVADFSGKPISGIAPLTVTFSDLSSNTPTSWNWSFGDDSKENATEQNPVHTYTSAGNYTVSLNATNAAGLNITTKMNYINVTAVLAAPVADFSGTPTSGRSPLTVQFNDTSTGFVSPITYFWNFGDGFNSTERNPTHTYSPSTPENYTVSLNVTGNYGKTDEMIKSGYITIEIPTIELIISNELQPDLSLPPDQSLPQAQSLPQGKSSLQAQSLSPSTLAHQDQSLPQDTPSQNDLSAQWIGGVWVPDPEIDWTLTKGENTIDNAFTMWVWSNEDWKVMVRDSDSNGKPNDLKGKMVEYDYSTTPPHYVLNGKNLTQHLNVKSGGNSYVQLSGENQQIQTGTTDFIWLWVYQIGLKQSVENSDTSLGSNRRYRIEITFEATTAA
jgi:PKD repeat protein